MSNIFTEKVSDLHFVESKVAHELSQNKNRRISSIFGEVRRDSTVYGIGDWPIMSLILQITSKFKEINQKQVWYMCRKSKEYQRLKYGEKQIFTKGLVSSINY